MEIVVRKCPECAAKFAAGLIAEEIKRKPNLTLGLATGRTMERLYAILGDMHKEDGLDFSRCRSFNLDEYVGMKGDDPNSYRYYMNKHLFSKINIDIRNTHVENGAAADPAAECANYEKMIAEEGGLDIQLLGIGRTGHIGFNEPLSPLTSRTRVVQLTKMTYEQNSPLFSDPKDMPMQAMTMGVGTILEAKKLILLATGAEKASIIAKAIEGPLTSMVSASALQLHQNCIVVLDEEAAANLQGRADYDFAFEHDPKWEGWR